MSVVRRVALGLVAAAVAAVAAGALARVMMRLATLAAGEEGSFSLAGTAGIVLVFFVFTLPGAVLAALLRRRGRSSLLVAGALLLCVPAAGVASQDLAGLGELSRPELLGVAASTVGVFASILALPFLTLRLLPVRARHRPDVPAPAGAPS